MGRRYSWTLTIELHADEHEPVPGITTHRYGHQWHQDITPAELLRLIVLAAGEALDR